MKLREFVTDCLLEHPWQKNIPNLAGNAYEKFKASILERGIDHAIIVSLRTNEPVIIDGHQRFRVAKELGYTHMTAIVKDFANETEEIIFLASSAIYRRSLNDAQNYRVGKLLEVEFAKDAAKNVGGRPARDAEKPPANLQENRSQRESATKAAEAVGMSPRQFHKAKTIDTQAPEPIKEAWQKGELSTHAAHQVAKAPSAVHKALIDQEITVEQSVAVQKNKDVNKRLESGEITVSEAVRLSDVIQRNLDDKRAHYQLDDFEPVADALEAVNDLSVDTILKAISTVANVEFGYPINTDIEEVLVKLQEVTKRLRTNEMTVEVAV